jgi:hypothetical protein
MNTPRHVSNYAILRFLPYPETGEFVNVGVLVACPRAGVLQFVAEQKMPDRAKSLFPRQNRLTFEAAIGALRQEMERLEAGPRDPKAVQSAFHEAVRVRESTFRFGEVRTILTPNPHNLAEELFARYVRMLEPAPDGTVVAPV